MRKSALFIGAAALAAISTTATAEPSADEIIASHVEALGGREAMAALKAVRREGRVVVPGFPADLRIVETRQRPGSVRVEVTLQGLTQVQAYDGKEAWAINPFQGRKDPERLSTDSADAKTLALQADMDTPLVDYKAKGAKVDYLGTEDVDGTPAHKLRVKQKSGDEATYFIDPDSKMIIRLVETVTARGAEQEFESDFGEYEKVAGVYVPMTVEFGAPGTPSTDKQKILYEKAEAIEPAPAATFSFPAGK